MIVAQRDAKNIICPFAKRFEANNKAAHNWHRQEYENTGDVYRSGPPQSTCLADQCMAWDWVDHEDGHYITIAKLQEITGNPELRTTYDLDDELLAKYDLHYPAKNKRSGLFQRHQDGERRGQCGRTPVVTIESERG